MLTMEQKGRILKMWEDGRSSSEIAFELKVFEDNSYLEISKILNCSVSSVESLIFRARQNLKLALKNFN